MNELDVITDFNSKNISLGTSKRMTRVYAYNQMKWDNPNDTKNRKLLNHKMVFSERLLNCGASEEQIKEIIRHEYCHAWADYGQNIGNGHGGKFIECCNILGCHSTSINPDKRLSKLCKEYLKDKEKNKKFNYRKIFNNIMTRVRYIDENYIRVDTKIDKNIIIATLTITEKYSDCADLEYLFDNTIKNIDEKLKTISNIEIIKSMDIIVKDGTRKAIIRYKHKDII
jgi:hypothetical protein